MRILTNMRISLINIFLSACILLSCATDKSSNIHVLTEDTTLLRPNPGYVQYVKNRSMLSEATSLLSTVSSSLHSFSTERGKAHTLRSMASVWLYINPSLYITDIGTSFLKSLDYSNLLEMISTTGIQGIYASPLFGTSYLWTNTSKMSAYNEDAVQLEIANDIGSLQEFMTLRTSIGELNMFFGTSLLPVATGMGADFWLATRGVDGYEGVYGLITIPDTLWHSLPSVEKATTVPLSTKDVTLLIDKNILPQTRIQDSLPYFPKTGWALTSEITDIHGATQRYAYRYYRMPELPLLHLHNPTLQATRIINASVVQSVGVYGSALVGFSLMPYYGLVNENQTEYTDALYIPIAQHIERMTQQYGAFAFLQDTLPLPLLAKVLADNDAVFVEDSITFPYAEYALLSQNTTLLQEMLRYARNLDIPIERLVHTTTHEQGLPLHPLALYTTDQKAYISHSIEQAHSRFLSSIQRYNSTYPFMTHESLPYTTPTLATISLGYPLYEHLKYNEKQYRDVLKAHKALLFFKAMLPGILMISTQDLTAPLPMKQAEYERTGNTWNERLAGYSGYTLQVLPYSTLVNRFSIPMAKTLYPEFQTQALSDYSITKEITQILKLRSQLGIENTSLIDILPTNDSMIAVVLQNEKKEIYIALTNFTNRVQEFSLETTLPKSSKRIQEHSLRLYPPKKAIKNKIKVDAFECILIHVK